MTPSTVSSALGTPSPLATSNASKTPHCPNEAGSTSSAGTAWIPLASSPIEVETVSGKERKTSHRHRSLFNTAHAPTTGTGTMLTLLLFVLLTLVASLNMEDAYGSWPLFMLTATFSAVLGALIAFAGTFTALRLWAQIVFLAVSQFIIGPVVALNSTTVAHIIPTVTTLTRGFTDTFASFKYVITVEPPLGSSGGALMALWTVDLWLCFLACTASLGASNISACLSALPLAANMAICALLGTTAGFATGIRGIILGLSLIIWLSARLGFLEPQRIVSSTVIIVLSVAVAFGGTLLLPSSRLTLRNRYDPPLNPYQFTSPLSGMRSYVKYHKKDTLLTVKGLPAGTPIRLAVMDRFDGNVWNLSDSRSLTDSNNGSGHESPADSSDYRHVGSQIEGDGNNDGAGTKFTATFTVHHGMNEQWLPLAGSAANIHFTHGASSENFYYNRSTSTGIYQAGLNSGQTYRETGTLKQTPTLEQVSKSSTVSTPQPKAKDIPSSASKLAPALAGSQATGGASAQKLADSLKDKGWFSHGLNGDYPSLSGHGNYRIDAMLGEGGIMVGDSEQYASAMALMAREIGLPSRVVLGFIAKDKDGNISTSRTKNASSATQATTQFTGNDIEAWTEINLKDYGWTAFYPTPKETKTPDQNQDITPPNPKNLVRQPPVPLVDPLHDKMQAREQSGANGNDAGALKGNPQLAAILAVARNVAVYGSPVWIVLLICLLILGLKALQIALMRHHGSPSQQVASGWQTVTMLAKQSGANLQGTRTEQAMQMAQSLGLDESKVRQVGRQADWASYSGEPVEEDTAKQYWQTTDALRSQIRQMQHGFRRIRTALSLRGVWTGFAKFRHNSSHGKRTSRATAAGSGNSSGKSASTHSDIPASTLKASARRRTSTSERTSRS